MYVCTCVMAMEQFTVAKLNRLKPYALLLNRYMYVAVLVIANLLWPNKLSLKQRYALAYDYSIYLCIYLDLDVVFMLVFSRSSLR